ncbi:hypothetical protein JG688_00013912 [Phytophthora aleatoria]|uniref:Crinkler (CRN) family protein n=1 Tax=Phytophthora aleatoria TaxID=2496075 RepID=A0A8J5I895_9STRA|nr:hypothetical protein JG688_00013912 [Phytophthora aleatoria]
MMSSWTVEEVLNEFKMTGEHAPSSKQVHVLVTVLGELLEAETVEEPHPRKRRWDKLNEVLDKNKKAKKSTRFFYVSFSDIDSIMPATITEGTENVYIFPVPTE